jgi:hypothetical protein
MVEQTYQEVSRVIAQDLIGLYRLGIKNLNKINLKEFKGEYQNYFYHRKNKHPKLYERLIFDTNGFTPYSKDLGSILDNFVVSGFLEPGKIIHFENVEKIKGYFKWREDEAKKRIQ